MAWPFVKEATVGNTSLLSLSSPCASFLPFSGSAASLSSVCAASAACGCAFILKYEYLAQRSDQERPMRLHKVTCADTCSEHAVQPSLTCICAGNTPDDASQTQRHARQLLRRHSLGKDQEPARKDDDRLQVAHLRARNYSTYFVSTMLAVRMLAFAPALPKQCSNSLKLHCVDRLKTYRVCLQGQPVKRHEGLQKPSASDGRTGETVSDALRVAWESPGARAPLLAGSAGRVCLYAPH